MITSHPANKTPNIDSQIDGGPKSAFTCVQRRCRSPPTPTTILNNGNNIDMTNSANLHSPAKVIKHSSDAILSSPSLEKHNMPFPQIYNIPLNNILSPNTIDQPQHISSHPGKFHELIKSGMNNNSGFKAGVNMGDVSTMALNKRNEQIAQLTQLHNQLSNNTNDQNSRYTAVVKDYVKSQLQMIETNASNLTRETIYGSLSELNRGIISGSHDVDQGKVGSNMIYPHFSQSHDNDSNLGTRVPATTQSDRCHQRARAIIQHNQSPEKIRRYNSRYPLPEKPRQKRAVIQDMVRPLKLWLLRHRHNPYPTKAEKVQLALGSNMTLVQVSNWFANARRRLKNVVQEPRCSWSKRLRLYNQFVQGNAELLSISSNDSIWNSDDEIDPEEYEIHKKNFQSSYRNGMDISGKGKYFDKQVADDEEEDLNVVDDSEDNSNQSSSGTTVRDVHEAREKYKKSILHRYLADSVDAVNTLQDDKKNTSENSENKDSIEGPSPNNDSEEKSPSKNVKSPNCRKRKISDSSDDNEEKILKTQNRGRHNITNSRSLDSVADYPNSNSSSNSSYIRRKSTHQGKSSSSTNQSRNNRPNGSYSIENLLSQPPFASSSHFRASVKSSEYQNTESYIKPNEFLISGGTINPWNYGALNMTDICRENAMPPIFPFLQHNPLGRTIENTLGLPPWKLPFSTSLLSPHPFERAVYHGENKSTTSVNKTNLTEDLSFPNGESTSYDPTQLRLNSEEMLTKETVDAAVALTSMANLNSLRRDTKTAESSKS